MPDEPCVIVSNHQGQWETFSMQYLFHPLCTLLKRELLYIHLWGWAMKMLKPIAIDRSKPKEAITQTLAEGSNRLSLGMYVLLFPEGTRGRPGKILPFRTGTARFSIYLDKPILPAVIYGSHLVWPRGKLFFSWPRKIKVLILKPIYPTSFIKVKNPSEEAIKKAEKEITEFLENQIKESAKLLYG